MSKYLKLESMNWGSKKHKFGVGQIMYEMASPTGNCQVAVLGYMNQLICSNGTVDEKKAILKSIKAGGLLPLAIVDINSIYQERFEELINKTGIVFKNAYNSTNGSSMVMYLVNTQRW